MRQQQDFEREHGFSPNVLYLNREQYQRLKFDLGDALKPSVGDRLGLDVILSNDSVHPHVGWTSARTGDVINGDAVSPGRLAFLSIGPSS